MVAVKIGEVVRVMDDNSDGFRIPKIGDDFWINLSDDKSSPNWIKFWTNPIRDAEEATQALEIIRSRGVGPIYSKQSFARDFKSVPQGYLPDLSELSV